MPADSLYPPVDIPNVDLWNFLFERKDKPFADDHGKQFKSFAIRSMSNYSQ